ncbi:response regulator [Carboxylicivirga linearis]|uniref:histidine kinase n=1 Tax=Carboxylicivirga linearis TaxID=1628157 RepID=A0ABS5JSY1_9BACT|nr:response regulator [Carboxylicivirga linearis]MBS2097978.1 response regulator [Carboxylicivirga linearis]
MRQLGAGGLGKSIQRKVIIGFGIIIMILFLVSFMSINGIHQLSHVVSNTEVVNRLQDQISDLRLNEKRVLISGNSSLKIRVDTISRNITNLLKEINQSDINDETKSELEPFAELVSEFNKNFSLYVSLHELLDTTDDQNDSLFKSIETIEINQFETIGKWFRPGSEKYNSVTREFNDIHSNLISIRVIQTRIQNRLIQGGERDTLNVRFDRTLKKSFEIENIVNNAEVREFMSDFRNVFRAYEQTTIQILNLSENINTAQRGLISAGSEMQKRSKKASLLQSKQLTKWGDLSMNFLIILVVVAILGAGFVLAFFIYTITSDERKRKDIEGAIEDNRRLLDDIINNSKALIFVKDLEGRYTLVNQNWCEEVGVTESEVIGKQADKFFDAEVVEHWNEVDEQVIKSGVAVHFEEGMELKKGRRYFLSNKFPIRNTEGEITAICSISTDITELNEALRDLERSRENYRNIVTNVPGIVYTGTMDDSRSMSFLSSGFTKVTGFDKENFLNGVQSFTNMIVEGDRERVLETIKQAVARNQSFEIEYRIEDVKGEKRWLHEKGMPIKQLENSGYYLQGVMIDMTAQKEAISEVMLRDRFLEGVAEAVKELIANQEAEEALLKSLRIVAQSAMVDHSFIFVNEPIGKDGQPRFSHHYEWQKDQIKPIQRPELQNVSYQEIGSRWYHSLADKKEISGFKDDFIKEEQVLFEKLNIQSILIVPVFARDEFWGFIGFGNINKGLPWVESNRAIFRAYTVTLGIAIAKERDSVLLKEAKDAAEAATQAKSDFLARMSHEIRTPMNAIVGWTHLAIEKEAAHSHSDYLHKIQASSKSLLGIINDILDFSKIEAGKLILENIDFDLEQVFDDLSNMVSYKAHEKGLEFIYALDADVPLNLVGDPLRLSQILINLVNNAIKFTNEGEVVTSVLVLQEDDNDVELLFEVKDSGIGIKPDLQQYLFESFSQADVSTTRKYGGTGLGLAICKRLTGLMGGRIWVESEYGMGSSFFFTVKVGKNKVQKRDLLIPPKDLEGIEILLIISHPVTSHIHKDMLELLGFKVTMVGSLEKAMVKLVESNQKKVFDLIIMDWELQRENNVDAAFELKKHNKNSIPLIILIPAFNQDPILLNFIESNPKVWSVVKPVNYSTIYDGCMEALGKEKSTVSWRKKEPDLYLKELKKLKDVLVLLVEDNEANQMIGIELLELANVSVEVASNGKEAVTLLKKRGPNYYDLILMDIQMPVMDGFDATKEILQSSGFKEMHIVAMTADAIDGAKEKYLKAGMVDMISKPIDPEQVYNKVLKWVNKQRGIMQSKRRPVKVIDQSENQIAENLPEVNTYPPIEGINVEEGVKRFANRWDFFKRLLQRFYFDHLNFVKEFNELKVKDREAAERMLHSFKGISGTISAPKLYEMAIKVEKYFKEDSPSFSEGFIAMTKELETILKELSINKEVDIEGVDKQNSN